ncbi:TonB-dependent receptor [uncultured Sphingomonas sp.]|jgi:iron complex outermembrane recepter protein|uniref:TonB-dependent receptor n=1 Tax=uncultured Sphingomonas sp. TaxID=158754 RepID=UPI0025F77D78|nr:TonB-dependent receptor [uncultured Sphingomonas sp.]
MRLRHMIFVTTALVSVAGTAHAQDVTAAAQSSSATTPGSSDDIVVTGYRKSLQDAIATKRRTNAIVDVISAEDVGKFPDTNVAESLSHLPGVTVDHQFGEGEQVSIAGVEPALNRILIDGHAIASADWGGNPGDRSSRTFNYSLLSPEIISQAVVYKTPEARIQEGAIGGTVDVVTRKPLDLKPNTFTATGGYEYNDRSARGNFRGSALYSWHNDSDTFAILGSVNYDKENLARAGVAVYGYLTGSQFTTTNAAGQTVLQNPNAVITGGTINDLKTARLPAFLAHEYFQQTRQRVGFTGTAQFKPTDNFTLTANAIVIRGNYDNFSNSEYSYNVRGSQLTAATISNGLITSATFAAQPSTSKTWMGELDTNFRRTRIRNDSFNMLFDWNVDGWKVTGNGGYTRASGGKNPEYLLNFRTRQGFTVGANGRNTMLNWDNPASDAKQWISTSPAESSLRTEPAVLAATNGAGFFGAQIGGITNAENTVDKEKFGQVDFQRDLDAGLLRKLWFGVRASVHNNQQTTYGGATFTNNFFTLADLGSYVLDGNVYNGLQTTGNATPYATLTQANAIKALTAPGTLNVTRPLDTGSFFQVEERIGTAYVQVDYETGKFRGNIGGRFVRTKDISNYYLSSGGRTTLVTAPRTDDRFLPSFNIAYDAGDTVVLRGAAAKVIARPRYSDLAGSLSLDDTQKTGSGGNPDLKPYAATNFGLSAEWYFAPGSYLSGELFYRDITNYIGNTTQEQTITNQLTGQTNTYSVSRPTNGGKASVTGFSVTAQANLIWGFGIQSNYTFASGETPVAGQGLPYLSRNTYNIVPYFEMGPFQARVSYNYRSKYFYGFGRLQSANITDGYRQLDFSATYNINEHFRVTANASNLLDETYYQYSSTPAAPTALYKNGRVFSLTGTARF